MIPRILLPIIFALSACSAQKTMLQPTKIAQAPEGMSSFEAHDEPCWIRSPDCVQQPNQQYVYFVGQSDRAYPSVGRPDRAAFASAQKDAELQYAKFLGVSVSSAMSLEQSESQGRTSSRFGEVLQETVQQRISDLKKADQYFVSNAINTAGERLWTVYILLKVDKVDIDKHRSQMLSRIESKVPEKQPKASNVQEIALSLFGLWEGAGVQDNDMSWTIKVKIGQQDSVIEYPSLGCEGSLILLEQSDRKMLFHETLSRSSGCITNGRVAITLIDAISALFEWYYPNGKKGGEGHLKKKI
ncbi:MAG: hypothetical protein H6999_00460 [Hahellaceae bacterium]|nr:hypothetical protein [Hahellaceae bacterium]MCP5168222.1 hypothetical protein [Hahellaceae bacterium]